MGHRRGDLTTIRYNLFGSWNSEWSGRTNYTVLLYQDFQINRYLQGIFYKLRYTSGTIYFKRFSTSALSVETSVYLGKKKLSTPWLFFDHQLLSKIFIYWYYTFRFFVSIWLRGKRDSLLLSSSYEPSHGKSAVDAFNARHRRMFLRFRYSKSDIGINIYRFCNFIDTVLLNTVAYSPYNRYAYITFSVTNIYRYLSRVCFIPQFLIDTQITYSFMRYMCLHSILRYGAHPAVGWFTLMHRKRSQYNLVDGFTYAPFVSVSVDRSNTPLTIVRKIEPLMETYVGASKRYFSSIRTRLMYRYKRYSRATDVVSTMVRFNSTMHGIHELYTHIQIVFSRLFGVYRRIHALIRAFFSLANRTGKTTLLVLQLRLHSIRVERYVRQMRYLILSMLKCRVNALNVSHFRKGLGRFGLFYRVLRASVINKRGKRRLLKKPVSTLSGRIGKFFFNGSKCVPLKNFRYRYKLSSFFRRTRHRLPLMKSPYDYKMKPTRVKYKLYRRSEILRRKRKKAPGRRRRKRLRLFARIRRRVRRKFRRRRRSFRGRWRKMRLSVNACKKMRVVTRAYIKKSVGARFGTFESTSAEYHFNRFLTPGSQKPAIIDRPRSIRRLPHFIRRSRRFIRSPHLNFSRINLRYRMRVHRSNAFGRLARRRKYLKELNKRQLRVRRWYASRRKQPLSATRQIHINRSIRKLMGGYSVFSRTERISHILDYVHKIGQMRNTVLTYGKEEVLVGNKIERRKQYEILFKKKSKLHFLYNRLYHNITIGDVLISGFYQTLNKHGASELQLTRLSNSYIRDGRKRYRPRFFRMRKRGRRLRLLRKRTRYSRRIRRYFRLSLKARKRLRRWRWIYRPRRLYMRRSRYTFSLTNIRPIRRMLCRLARVRRQRILGRCGQRMYRIRFGARAALRMINMSKYIRLRRKWTKEIDKPFYDMERRRIRRRSRRIIRMVRNCKGRFLRLFRSALRRYWRLRRFGRNRFNSLVRTLYGNLGFVKSLIATMRKTKEWLSESHTILDNLHYPYAYLMPNEHFWIRNKNVDQYSLFVNLVHERLPTMLMHLISLHQRHFLRKTYLHRALRLFPRLRKIQRRPPRMLHFGIISRLRRILHGLRLISHSLARQDRNLVELSVGIRKMMAYRVFHFKSDLYRFGVFARARRFLRRRNQLILLCGFAKRQVRNMRDSVILLDRLLRSMRKKKSLRVYGRAAQLSLAHLVHERSLGILQENRTRS